MKRIMIPLTLCLLALPLSAASVTTRYGYNDLVSSMQLNNAELRKADQSVVQSKLDVKDAKANYQPTVEMNLTGTYMTNPPVGKLTLGVDELSSQLGISSIPGIAQSGYVTLYDGMENSWYNASFSLTQPIFTWGKIPKSVKLYETISDIMAIDRIDKEDQLSIELKIRLSALAYLDEILSVLDETRTLTDELVQAAVDGYENGMLLAQDVTDARVSALELDVKRQEVEKQYSSTLQGVRTITGIKELSTKDLAYQVDETRINELASVDGPVFFERATASDVAPLSMLQKQTAALSLKNKIDKSDVYWKPDLALQVTANFGGSRFPLIEKNWYQKDDFGLYVTVAIKTTVWDGGKKLNAIKYSQSEILSSEADYDAAVEQLSASVEENWTGMNLAKAKIDYLTMKKQSAESRLELLRNRMEVGATSNTEVLKQRIEVQKIIMEILEQKISLAQAAYTLEYLAKL